MDSRVIDFRAHRKNRADGSTRKETDRSLAQIQEARRLRSALEQTQRLSEADRATIVRNLGRIIEREFSEGPKQVANDLLSETLGESAPKKRKRYVLFEGENAEQVLAATRRDFLRLIDALAQRMHHPQPTEARAAVVMLMACDGASFTGQARPRLFEDRQLADTFQDLMQRMVDRIARDTDIIAYLDEVQNYTISTLPARRDDCDQTILDHLPVQTFPINRFKHIPNGEEPFFHHSFDGYTRLQFSGYDLDTEAPSPLFPRIRLARIYWPREMLCLKKAVVPAKTLIELRKRPLTGEEASEAIQLLSDLGRDMSGSTLTEVMQDAASLWRCRQERLVWDNAVRQAGLEPSTMDWRALEKPDGSAVEGAEWRTFWQAMSIDLHLVADSKAENLKPALFTSSLGYPHWTAAGRDLVEPRDDKDKDAGIYNCQVYTPYEDTVPWFPVGNDMQVCRGLIHYLEDGSEIEFSPPEPNEALAVLAGNLVAPLDPRVWPILTQPMSDWQERPLNYSHPSRRDDTRAALRPLFEAPEGWTPAPDNSLASAIMRSIAYGQGSERLDEKLIASTNNLVACLRDMKGGLAQNFHASLVRAGYADD